MNTVKLKFDFYKRFGSSPNRLISESCGMLCPLLGFYDVNGMSALGTTLSMGIGSVCRRLDGDMIKIADTDSKNVLTYYLKDFPQGQKLGGAQILMDNCIPEYFDSKAEMLICTIKCLMNVGQMSEFDRMSAAEEFADEGNIMPYLALFEARKGYAVLSNKNDISLVPLPLTGCKFILVWGTEKRKSRKNTQKAMEMISRRYPHVSTFADLDDEMLRYASTVIHNRGTIKQLMYLAGETKRISHAAAALKSMRVRTLFEIIRESAREYVSMWEPNRKISRLLSFALSCDGIEAARPLDGGVMCIVRDELVDYVISSFSEHFSTETEGELRFCVAD